jgi:mono/diheme cytochrome c family protein
MSMKLKNNLFRLALIAAAAFVSVFAIAADKVDIGKQEYEASCANCHGLKGEGNGPYMVFLKSNVPKLTTLSKNNGGVFPYERVYDTIDGRYLIESHGKDMPIWGNRYCTDVSKRLWDDYPVDAESYVRSRILALIDYINRLQKK